MRKWTCLPALCFVVALWSSSTAFGQTQSEALAKLNAASYSYTVANNDVNQKWNLHQTLWSHYAAISNELSAIDEQNLTNALDNAYSFLEDADLYLYLGYTQLWDDAWVWYDGGNYPLAYSSADYAQSLMALASIKASNANSWHNVAIQIIYEYVEIL